MTEFPNPQDVQRTKDILAVDCTLTAYKVLIADMAFDDNTTYPKLVTELADLIKLARPVKTDD
jgi:hypothetical protein